MSEDKEPSDVALRALLAATKATEKIDSHIAQCVASNADIQRTLGKLDGRMWAVLVGVAGMFGLTLLQMVTDGRIKGIFDAAPH